MTRKKPFYTIGLIGLAVALLAVVMGIIQPMPIICHSELVENCITLTPGLGNHNFILAVEFATQSEHIHGLFGNLTDMDRGKLVAQMYADMAFIALYVLFLSSLCVQISSMKRRNGYLLGVLLALGAGAADVLENNIILDFANNYSATADYSNAIHWLRIYTWSKWGALTLIFFLLFFYFRKGFNNYQKALGYVSGWVPLLLIAPAFFLPEYFSFWFAMSIFGAFALVICYCLLFKKPNSNLRFF